jgi:hypothetical protein
MYVCDYRRGLGLQNEFVDLLYTRLVTTNTYSATANLNISQITTAPAKPFLASRLYQPFPGKGF